jgi:hypothetical protein
MRYDSCHPNTTFQSQSRNKKNGSRVNRRTMSYREDTSKDQGWAFFAGGFASPAPNEDGPTIMAVATPTTDKNGGPCKTPSKRGVSVTNGTTLTLYGPKDTSARWGCSSRPVDDPVSIWVCSDQRVLMKIPAYWLKM